jgi:hypothetical protein
MTTVVWFRRYPARIVDHAVERAVAFSRDESLKSRQ